MAVDTAKTWSSEGRKHAPKKKRAQKGFKAWLRRWWWVFVVVPAAAMLLVIGMLLYVYSRLELPSTPPPLQTTYIYDRDGNQIATLHAGVDRTIIPLSEIPKTLQHAVIAVEDHDFYHHPGIDPVGIVRAAWTDLVARDTVQGASTITQQLVKNVYSGEYVTDPQTGEESYVEAPRTFGQKIREALLAIKVEQTYSKDEILAKYLNTVYFGRGAYGVQAAAQTYWQKDAKDLTVAESAMLAGLIQAPSYFDPVEDPYTAKPRRDFVLDRMAAEGYLTADRAAAIEATDVRTNAIDPGVRFGGKDGYFLDYVRRELIRDYNEGEVFGGGLKVTTTIDMDLQHAAEQAVAGRLPSKDDPDAALVAMDPRTGEVLAMYGGRNFNADKVNLAMSGVRGYAGTGRQAGSAFKPFTLVAALEQHYSLSALWSGPSPITITDPACYTNGLPWTLSNASDSESGTFSLLAATTHSVNTVYAQVASAVTPQAIVDVAERMGIRSTLDPVCSITLGTQSVAPIDMTTAYATLAARGLRHRATPLQEVDHPDGTVDHYANGPGVQVLDRNVADLASYALETVITSGTGTNASIGRPAAGKTGTNQEYRDAWFCGYTPQLATCVWMGYKEGQIAMPAVEGYYPVYGGTLPALIWHDFMSAALEGRPVREFVPPSFEGYTQGPPTPVPAPSPSPSPTESPSPEPTQSPSPKPTVIPTPSPSPSPTETGTPSPPASPSPPVGVRRDRGG